LDFEEFQFGAFRRILTCITIDLKDSKVYCGTTSGDVVLCDLRTLAFRLNGPHTKQGKPILHQGISAITSSPTGSVVVGTGTGDVIVLHADNLTVIKRCKVTGGVSSLCFREDGDILFLGTLNGTISKVQFPALQVTRLATSHVKAVNQLCFPFDCSELVLSCSNNNICVWHSIDGKELLRITCEEHDKTLVKDTAASDEGVIECQSIFVPEDGKLIVSGWGDGSIRGYTPETGKLKWKQEHTHANGIGAIAFSCTSGTGKGPSTGLLLSGGGDGAVKLWKVGPQSQTLLDTMKEHTKTIVSLQFSRTEGEAMSASVDGTCVIWNLSNGTRKSIFYTQTILRGATYHPEEGQVVTVGTDKKISYWDTASGTLLRAIETSSSLNCVAITADGDHILVGGEDGRIHMYGYDSGEHEETSDQHSSEINTLTCSPDSSYAVAGGMNGDIYFWDI
jgi:WD40 repeat protein